MLSRIGLSVYICGILSRGLSICDSDSNFGRHNIWNFGLCVSLLTVSSFVRYRVFFVQLLPWCLFPDLIIEFRYGARSYVFCCTCSTTFNKSKSFTFNSLCRNFLSVIDAMNFDIIKFVLNSGKLRFFSKSSNFSQWSSGVSVSVCFAQKKSPLEFYFFPFGR